MSSSFKPRFGGNNRAGGIYFALEVGRVFLFARN